MHIYVVYPAETEDSVDAWFSSVLDDYHLLAKRCKYCSESAAACLWTGHLTSG